MARQRKRGANRPHRTGRRTAIPPRVVASVLENLFVETEEGDAVGWAGGCWIPDGSTNNRGYKRRSWQDESGRYWHLFTHQIMARLIHMAGKPLPEGAEVHHLCQNTECCNPLHLEVVSPIDHRRRHEWLFASRAA